MKAKFIRGSRMDFLLNSIAGLLLTLIILAAMERILATEAKARQKADQLQLTLENMSQGIMLVTSDLQIPIINTRCGELLGLPAEFIKNPAALRPSPGVPVQDHRRAAKAGQPHRRRRRNRARPRRQFSISERTMPNGHVIEVRSGHLPDGSFVQTFTDITKRREAEAHVARLASEDPLTGLPNRRVFRATVEELCRVYQSLEGEPERAEFAVLFLDRRPLQGRSTIRSGHRIGDMLLQEVANRLKGVAAGIQHSGPPRRRRVRDRRTGDAVAALLETLANCIIETVVQPYEIDGYRIRSSVSIGIAVGPRDGDNRRRSADGRRSRALRGQGERRGTFQVLRPVDERGSQ